MKRAARPGSSVAGVTLALLLLAALLRLIALSWGLPHVFTADEPQSVDMAVSLAANLRPLSPRAPTLWPMLLAACYGAWFIVWSGFGLARGALDFAAKYAFEPSGFYLIARALGTLCQLGAFLLLARAEREEEGARWPYGAALLAAAPLLVALTHSTKPDSLMLLLAAAATTCAVRFQSGGARSWLLSAAVLSGLACSTRYEAAPVALVVALAWLLREGGGAPLAWLFEVGLAASAGFLLGTPAALLDHSRFLADWSDSGDLGRLRPHDAAATARLVLKNLWCFAGEGSLGGAAAVAGVLLLARRNARRAALLLMPVAAWAAVLATSPDGASPRSLIGLAPALVLLAGEGFSWLAGKAGPWRRGFVAALALLPGLFLSGHLDAELLRPDTRTQAAEWLRQNVPAGSTILLDQPSVGPRVLPSKEQCLQLASRAEQRGSSRARLYRAMAAGHPGGGWRIERIQRGAQPDGDFLDVRPGLDVVRAARVEWVVTSSEGADPRRSRELTTFFTELTEQTELMREFPSGPGLAAGPWLRVFRLAR